MTIVEGVRESVVAIAVLTKAGSAIAAERDQRRTKMTSRSAMGVVAAAAIAGAVAFGFAAAAPRGDHLASGAGAGPEVSKAEFDRLEGKVQDLERRVSALERGSGGLHSAGGGHHTAGDSWENH